MRALYLGEDDALVGLYHGRHYEIEKKTAKNGRVTVIVEDLLGMKMRYRDKVSFQYEWVVKK